MPQTASKAQQRVLDAIAKHWSMFGYGPTYREIGKELGIRSTNGVSDHVKRLVRLGLVLQDYGVQRSLRLKPPKVDVFGRPIQ